MITNIVAENSTNSFSYRSGGEISEMDLRAKVKLSAGLCSFLEDLGEKLLSFPVS